MSDSINEYVFNAVHRPNIKLEIGRRPLYARSTDYKASEHSRYDYTDNPRWVEKSKESYNSPNNIRRILIGNDYVGVEYYKPPKANGYTRFMVSKLAKDENTSNRKVLEFMTRYAIPNVEEIYFGEDMVDRIFENTNIPMTSYTELIQLYNSNKEEAKSELNKYINIAMNKNYNRDLSEEFLRLKSIGYVSNLDERIQEWERLYSKYHENSEEDNPRWAMLDKIKGGCILVACKNPNYAKIKDSKLTYCHLFEIRPGLYEFDRDTLKEYVEKYPSKFVLSKPNMKKTELESMFDSASKESLSNTIKTMLTMYGIDCLMEEVEKMSDVGKERYSGIVVKLANS